MSRLEITANAFNAISILLAGRYSIHTWWTGIFGCMVFAIVFFGAQLYADVTLQVFFIGTSFAGWWQWRRRTAIPERPIQRTGTALLGILLLLGVGVTGGYGWILHRYTNAFAPFLDSVILSFSVLGQFLLMNRRIETWWCWLLVNTIAVPLYFMRGLPVTAVLYAGFWINAIVSYRHWHRLLRQPAIAIP